MKKTFALLLLLVFIHIMAGCTLQDSSPVVSGSDNLNSDIIEDIIFSTQHQVYGNDIDRITCFIQNNTNEEYLYGEPYSIERLIGEKWQQVPFPEEPMFWNSIGYILKPNSTNTIYIYLSICDYMFIDGTYRICKEIGNKNYYAEFELGKSNITASTPYGFLELEKIKADYTPEQAIADGVVVIKQNEIANLEMVDKFISDVSRNTASLLRIVQYTIEGDPIISDITFVVNRSNSYFSLRTNTLLDKFGGQDKGIHETIYSYLVTHGKDIFLSNHAVYDNKDGEYVRLIHADTPPEWKNAVNLIKQVTKDRLSSNSTTYKVFSTDGTKCIILTKEPLEFGYDSSSHGEIRSIENKMGIAIRINEALWADDNVILLVCKTNSDLKYYEFFDVESRSVISYTANIHDYSIEGGKILIPE